MEKSAQVTVYMGFCLYIGVWLAGGTFALAFVQELLPTKRLVIQKSRHSNVAVKIATSSVVMASALTNARITHMDYTATLSSLYKLDSIPNPNTLRS